MPRSTKRRSSSPSQSARSSGSLSRRELLAGAGAGAAAILLGQSCAQEQAPPAQAPPAQAPPGSPVVFTHTTVVNADATQDDVALAVEGDKIAAIGPTDQILQKYPNADVYDGRGKAILPGLINCHAHMAAVLQRGYNEDFGFPNSYKLAVQPSSLLQGEENTLMVQIAALEALKTGTTTIMQLAGNIRNHAEALAQTGLRCVFAETISDCENYSGAMTLDRLADSKEPPRFSPKLREEGLQRANDLFTAWHGKNNGRISVFPVAGLAETSSQELLKAVSEFADKNDLGYTCHLSQTTWEDEFMKRWHGVTATGWLYKAGFLGPRFFAGHARYLSDGDIALLGKTRSIISHQANMSGNRAVNPPIAKLRAAGCTIANGTDNNTNDVFQVMRTALIMERISRTSDVRPGLRPQPEDMLADCTQGGAAAAKQEKTIGTLEVGKKADLFVMNIMKPHMVPCGRILSAIIHGGQSSDIESTMVDGQFLMRSNKVLTMNEPALLAEADKVGRRVWAKVVEASGPVKFPREPRPR